MHSSQSNGAKALHLESNNPDFSKDELALLGKVIHALRDLRYGSVNLTVHDGRLVEIQKIEKIRMSGNKSVGAVETQDGF